MSTFLRQVAFVMDDDSAKKSVLIKIFHIFFGNMISAAIVAISGTFIVIHAISGRLNMAEATISYVMLMGVILCLCSVSFFRRARPHLLLIFTHLANAAETLENLNVTTKTSLEKEMAKVRLAIKLQIFGMWFFNFSVVLGPVFGQYAIKVWLLDNTSHWFRVFVEVVFHFQAAGTHLPGVCATVVAVVFATGTLFDTMNNQLRQCKANERLLTKMIRVHQELLEASLLARNLFQSVFLAFGFAFISGLLFSSFNMASGCFGVLAVAAAPLSIMVILNFCETGDVLVRKSLETKDAVCDSGWEHGALSFRRKVLLILLRAQRPAHFHIRYVGVLNRSRLTVLKKVYSMFTLMLNVFDGTHCGGK